MANPFDIEGMIRRQRGDAEADAYASGGGKAGIYGARAEQQMGGAGDLYDFQNRAGRSLYYGDRATLREAPQAGRSAFRAQQRQQLGRLTDMAEGRGPSLARQQATDALQRGVSTQQALAASARPGQGAMAARNAAQQSSLLSGSVAGASAAARAQEQLGAMNQLTGAIQGARAQDQSLNLANMGSRLQQTGMNDQLLQGMYDLELRNAMAQQSGGLQEQGMKNQLIENAYMRDMARGQNSFGNRLLNAGLGAGAGYLASRGNPAGAAAGAATPQTQQQQQGVPSGYGISYRPDGTPTLLPQGF